MAKTRISEYDSTANNNTDVASVNIDEGCAPSGINNAIRAVMAHLKDFQQGTNGDSFNGPHNGTVGATTPAAGTFTTLSTTGNTTLGNDSGDVITINGTTTFTQSVSIPSGSFNGAIGSTTPSTGAFTTLSASSTATLNTLASSGATLTGGTINNMAIGGSTAAAGAFTTLAASGAVTISGGTANGVAYLNGSKVLTSGSALTFDGTTFAAPSAAFYSQVTGTSTPLYLQNDSTTGTTVVKLAFRNNGSVKASINAAVYGNDYLAFNTGSDTEQMRLTSTGLGIGTSSPTNALSVSGNANITGNTTLGDASTDTVTVNGYMGVGGAGSTSNGLSVVSSALTGAGQIGFLSSITATSAATNNARAIYGKVSTAAAAFTVGNVYNIFSDDVTKGAGSTVTNQHGLYIADQTQGANNYGITSAVSSGSNKWNIYASGTAANYFAGNVGIGTSSPSSYNTSARNLVVANASGDSGITIHAGASSVANLLFTDAADVNVDGLIQYDNASDFMRFWTNGNERARIDSSGNFGLGVTPSAWDTAGKAIQVGVGGAISGDTSTYSSMRVVSNGYYNSGWKYIVSSQGASRYEQYGGAHSWYTAPSGTAGNAISFTQAMTLDASGNLLVGRTSRLANELVSLQCAGTAGANTNGILINYTGTPNDTTHDYLQCVDGNWATTRASVRSNGGIANYQANNVNLSDKREKTEFAPAKQYLETICAIPVQTFKYIDQLDEESTLGVVAQDVQAVAPELVMESNWGTEEEPKMRLSIYQTDLQYALMKCIQEQQAIINSLKARLDAANL